MEVVTVHDTMGVQMLEFIAVDDSQLNSAIGIYLSRRNALSFMVHNFDEQGAAAFGSDDVSLEILPVEMRRASSLGIGFAQVAVGFSAAQSSAR